MKLFISRSPGYLFGLQLVGPFHLDELFRRENHAAVRLGILRTKRTHHYSSKT